MYDCVVYFLIIYKPWSLVYKLSGVMMCGLLLAGYGVTIANIKFTKESKCNDTALGSLSTANAVIFLVVASLVLVSSHTIVWYPICQTRCCRRRSPMGTHPEKVSPNNESATNNQLIPQAT